MFRRLDDHSRGKQKMHQYSDQVIVSKIWLLCQKFYDNSTMYLPQTAFIFNNTTKQNWETKPGKYSLLIGDSSQNTQQVLTVDIRKSF